MRHQPYTKNVQILTLVCQDMGVVSGKVSKA